MKVLAIVQARMGSSRLPGKVMKEIGGLPVIEILLSRLSKSKLLDEIVVATTKSEDENPLIKHLKKLKYLYYQGSEHDVLDRFYQTAKKYNADIVVRITGDNPLVDPVLVDQVIQGYSKSNSDYFSNVMPATFPDGLDVEVFNFNSLDKAHRDANELEEREHVTPYIRNSGLFKIGNLKHDDDLSNIRLTLDEIDDYKLITKIFDYFAPDIYFSWTEILKLKNETPDIFNLNNHIERNEGAILGEGQKLYKRAKNVIPGGNMLLSKRPEMFLPDQWPAYFKRAKGCKVWDLDDRELTDISIMGIGTNILGYGHPEVDEAVISTVSSGNMSTLNCPEEVLLAEKLVDMHPWADMVRFSRSGGEANSIAIRIARAFSGRDKVAVCGYHGWHDWYLSANLSNKKGLDGHLLPGLNPAGVPRGLQGTVLPFKYNNFEELEDLVNSNEIGVIKMEVERTGPPKDDFLKKVRKLATEKSIVLIFDECTSGFRETFGGLHKKYDVEPDMAMFGKALGNGYAITGVIGKREVMDSAQSTFISSTFWTERVGPTAALKTLEIMEREKSWEQITNTGKSIRETWKYFAKKHELDLDHWGLSALPGFSFKSKNALKYKTFITQEMLTNGYLASNTIFVCTEHTSEMLDGYFENLDRIFKIIKECENGRDINKLLNGPVCHSGFSRLN
jgi:glutamate-1-semialdehyde 2,1-aminomutase